VIEDPEQKPGTESPDRPLGEVVTFLMSLGGGQSVELRETHGALIFLYSDRAIKIKKPVAFPYMDFSTLDRRHKALERELEVNRPLAPDLYREVLPIVRRADGSLGLGGKGPIIEWALVMARFDEGKLFSNLARHHQLDRNLIDRLAKTVTAHHENAVPHRLKDASAPLERIIEELVSAFEKEEILLGGASVADLTVAQKRALEPLKEILSWRSRQGFVRRCHGDLHLRNIVLWQNQPCLFDAIEFDEDIAIIDTLYDLAFLLMDLDVLGLREEANFLLNRYLFHSELERDPKALALLPLFLSCRAGIRAMVALDRRAQAPRDEMKKLACDVRTYFDAAGNYLEANQPCLLAVGGFSGSGKTTLASSLAPDIGRPLGSLHLRSDLVRKKLFNQAEFETLPTEAYDPAITLAVYETLQAQARAALEGGTSVIVDAVHAKPEERQALEELAEALKVPFLGLWLQAAEDKLRARVGSRKDDASDATADVVRTQMARGAGTLDWHLIDAKDSPNETLLRALVVLREQGILSTRA
jgi:aminoglycoside phosphotransferase family enzyme